jgi:N-methylhydantoinase A/oxoprolinase/acetone carboxylase beta subunit
VLTVDIDVGGTLTDGIFSDGDRLICCKVDTTTHDLTVCLFDCLTQGAADLGYSDLDSLLEEVELIRWSTTITSNVLAERSGPRVGLLITRGHEQDLYGLAQRSPILDRLVLARDVVALNNGAAREHITHAARSLLESGVRRVCISLEAAHLDPKHEIRIKEIIDQQYPDHFLGSVPVLAGSDISNSGDDMTRTCCAVLNAYTHSALAAALFKAEDELREGHRYSGTFLVSHINGGVSGIAKAKAIDTIESGPVLGTAGSAFFASAYGCKDVVALDVGGTTAKVSVLSDSAPIQVKPSDFFGIPVDMSLPYLRSIGLGGGSVIKLVPANGRGVALGPESVGSLPGPVCYSLGGDQPTLTDAFVAAGLINPDYFLGGTRQLDADASRNAIKEAVAGPLNITVDKAASIAIDAAFGCVADLIAAASSELKRDFSRHTLFAYGGNGGLFACGVADKAALTEVYLFALGAVFSAFGSSVSDISHVYERSLRAAPVSTLDVDWLNQIVDQMKAEAKKDMLGEGIEPSGVDYSLELEISGPGRTAVSCPEHMLRTPNQLRDFLESWISEDKDQLCLDLARLRAKKRMPKPVWPGKPIQGVDCSRAQKGLRNVAWGSDNGEARIYSWELLLPGNLVEGCAVIEGVNTTYFVPEGWTMTIDQHGNAILRRRSG